jgi:hypothetical protein
MAVVKKKIKDLCGFFLIALIEQSLSTNEMTRLRAGIEA